MVSFIFEFSDHVFESAVTEINWIDMFSNCVVYKLQNIVIIFTEKHMLWNNYMQILGWNFWSNYQNMAMDLHYCTLTSITLTDSFVEFSRRENQFLKTGQSWRTKKKIFQNKLILLQFIYTRTQLSYTW